MTLDLNTGSTDLAWLLVLLFFLTTFTIVRPSALLTDVSAESGLDTQPVVVLASAEGWSIAETAGIAPAHADARRWLAENCNPQIPAVLQCHDDATHSWCRQQLGELVSASSCSFRY